MLSQHSDQSQHLQSSPAKDGRDKASSDGSWYCVYTRPKQETLAVANLENQDYRCFLPTISKTIRHARRSTRVKAALFPRYLFLHADLGVQAWRPIRSTIGVTDLVLENDRPKPVPDGVVESLLAAVNDQGCLDFRDGIQVGEKVRMLSRTRSSRQTSRQIRKT